jgi:DNA-3-methyladenine glycosylase I
MIAYHDHEWGVPSYDDRHQFEMLILEGAQAGLSWDTILRKREGYRAAFDNFDVHRIASYGEADVARLLANPGIVRNRLKIASAITNARAAIATIEAHGSLSAFLWQFTGGKPIVNHHRAMADIPPKSAVSDAMSKELLRAGYKFVGSTICYAHMQAVGMVNDHLITCPRHAACRQ